VSGEPLSSQKRRQRRHHCDSSSKTTVAVPINVFSSLVERRIHANLSALMGSSHVHEIGNCLGWMRGSQFSYDPTFSQKEEQAAAAAHATRTDGAEQRGAAPLVARIAAKSGVAAVIEDPYLLSVRSDNHPGE